MNEIRKHAALDSAAPSTREIETDVVVIGGGPAGYAAAIRSAQAGLETVCVEREKVGGVCLNYGCIPSKALITVAERYRSLEHSADLGIVARDVSLDMRRVAERTREVVSHHTGSVETLLSANGARLVSGRARFESRTSISVSGADGSTTRIVARRGIVIATGVEARRLPGFEPDEERILTARSAVFLDHVPEHLIVLGGGVIGLELGSAYQNLGSRLTVVELGPRLLPGTDPDLVRVVEKRLAARGAEILLETRALGWRSVAAPGEPLELRLGGPGGERVLSGSHVLVAAGFVASTAGLGLEALGVDLDERGHVKIDASCRTNVPGIYAIGDIAGTPYLAHKAYADASVVADVLAGRVSIRDFRAIPAAIFSDPEIAVVGLTEEQARAEGRSLEVGRFPFSASGRASARGETQGFVKLLAEKGRLVGAAVVGIEASELIAELTLALEVGATLEDLSLTIHPHPTLSEAIHDAADHGLGRAVHIQNRKGPRRAAPLPLTVPSSV